MATRRYWVKFWVDTLDDARVASLPDWIWRKFFEFCLVAGEYGKDGYLPPVAQLAWRIRTTEGKCRDALQALSKVGAVVEKPEGWFIVAFPKRQAKVEDTERQQRHRKPSPYGHTDVTDCDTRRERDESDEIEDEDEESYQHQPFYLMSRAFERALGIPVSYPQRWNAGVQQLIDKGITPEDVPALIQQLPTDYTVTGPWSVAGQPANIYLERKNGIRNKGGGRKNAFDLALEKARGDGKPG